MKSPIALAIEALDKFGQHKSGCNIARALPFEQRRGELVCTCGFDNARTALAELKAASLISPTDEDGIKAGARAIRELAPNLSFRVQAMPFARAAISAYVAAMGGE